MLTKIEWTDESWNPITGCTPCSPGCAHCYAERMARRLAGRYGYPKAPHHFDVTLHPDRIDAPLKRKKPTMYFVCSMSDLFHEDIPPVARVGIWGVMRDAPQHVFQVLTKRADRMQHAVSIISSRQDFGVLSNVWLGVSVENQATADERISILKQTPAAVRFVSFEPLLSNVVVGDTIKGSTYDRWLGISWAIVGGESGPGARPMHPDWARSLRDQCQTSGTPYLFKQHGAWLHSTQLISATTNLGSNSPTYNWPDASTSYCVGKKRAGRLLDGQVWNQFPVSAPG